MRGRRSSRARSCAPWRLSRRACRSTATSETSPPSDEVGVDEKSGKAIVHVDPNYFRPTAADLLLGDPSKAKAKLGWEAKTTFHELVTEMVDSDLKVVEQESWRNDWTAR